MSGKVTKELLEGLLPDWDVTKYSDTSYDISSHSPAGENVIMSLVGDTFDEMARFAEGYYNEFDPRDHAAQIYHAKHYGSADEQSFYAGAPEYLEDLIADAEEIDEMYYAVYQTLYSAWQEEKDDGNDSEDDDE